MNHVSTLQSLLNFCSHKIVDSVSVVDDQMPSPTCLHAINMTVCLTFWRGASVFRISGSRNIIVLPIGFLYVEFSIHYHVIRLFQLPALKNVSIFAVALKHSHGHYAIRRCWSNDAVQYHELYMRSCPDGLKKNTETLRVLNCSPVLYSHLTNWNQKF